MNTDRISRAVVKLRWVILLTIISCSAFMGYQLTNLRIDADVLSSLPDDDHDALMLKQIGEKFGGNRMGVIIVEAETIYNAEVIRHIRQITDSVARIEGISSVQSLTNIINIKGGGFGIEIGQLVDEFEPPSTPEEFEQLRSDIQANPMYRGSIVSDDGTAALVVFTLADQADVNQVAQQVIDKTNQLELEEKIYYIGSPMLITYIAQLMKRDLSKLLPIAFLLIAVVLFISFRSVSGVLLPLLTAVLAIIWTLGMMAVTGTNMSMISNNVPIILLAIGSAYGIHVVNRINLLYQRGDERYVARALSYVLVPVILAAITTGIGFVSFIFGAYLQMIVEFGMFTAFGTAIACLLSIFMVPAIISITGKRPLRTDPSTKGSADIQALKYLTKAVFRHPRRTVGIWLILMLISFAGIFMIERSVDIQEYFKKGNPTRLAEQIMVEKFGGTKPVFVHFKGQVQDPEMLAAMLEVSEYMEQSDDIQQSMSIATLIAELNYAITGNREIPEDQAMVEQLWFLLDGNEVLTRFVSEDLSEAIILSKFKSPDNEAKIEFSKYMRPYLKKLSNERFQIEITGMPFVDITMDRSLIESQLGSISIAIIFVILIVSFSFRSIRNGLFAALPIISAILLLFGIMGIGGISLNIATVLVASVALGIGIDYSIHIISHFNKVMGESGNVEIALSGAIKESGKAIIINVISVSTGFLVLLFSDMVPLQYFGILIAVSMVSSGLGALTLLPAILLLTKKKNNTFGS